MPDLQRAIKAHMLLFTIDQPIQLSFVMVLHQAAVGEHIWSWRKPMIGLQRFGMLVACLVLLEPQGSAQDLRHPVS